MTFRDPQLQRHCERTASVVKGCPAEQLPVLGLLDAWYWFRLVEGEESPRVAEAIEHLLSPELRPALRQWYRHGGDMNEGAVCFRDRLSELAGEKFG
jgi:hypothetical protein